MNLLFSNYGKAIQASYTRLKTHTHIYILFAIFKLNIRLLNQCLRQNTATIKMESNLTICGGLSSLTSSDPTWGSRVFFILAVAIDPANKTLALLLLAHLCRNHRHSDYGSSYQNCSLAPIGPTGLEL